MTLGIALKPLRLVLVAALALGVSAMPGSSAVSPVVPVTEQVGTTSLPKVRRWKAAELRMMRWINRERTDEGLNALKFRKTLGYLGRKHSRKMRSAGFIFHSDLSRTVRRLRWRTAGENVGVGPTAGALHKAFMASPGHRANVLASGYDRVGVGLVTSAGGVIWVTVLFLG